MVDASVLENLTSLGRTEGIEKFVIGAIVEHGDTVLLLKRPADDFMGGIWELPSGNVEAGEALDTALMREVKEETGLDVSRICEYIGSFDYRSGSGKQARQFNFVVDVHQVEPVTLTEHDDHTWLPLTEELPVTDAVKEVFRKYRELRGM